MSAQSRPLTPSPQFPLFEYMCVKLWPKQQMIVLPWGTTRWGPHPAKTRRDEPLSKGLVSGSNCWWGCLLERTAVLGVGVCCVPFPVPVA